MVGSVKFKGLTRITAKGSGQSKYGYNTHKREKVKEKQGDRLS